MKISNMKTAQEKIDLIDKWSTFFIQQTESWYSDLAGELGAQLAYLFAAMATGISIDLYDHDELICILYQAKIPLSEDIWEYIIIIPEGE
jgi:hypothetical protein